MSSAPRCSAAAAWWLSNPRPPPTATCQVPSARGKIITACTVSRGQSYRTHASPTMAGTRNNTPTAADPQVPAGSVTTRTADAAAVTPTAPAASRTRRGIRRGAGMAKPSHDRPEEASQQNTVALTSRNAHQTYGYAMRARQCFPAMLAPRSRGLPSSRPLRRPLLSALAHTGIVPRVPCTVSRSPVPLTLTNAPICRHAFARPCSTFRASTPDMSPGAVCSQSAGAERRNAVSASRAAAAGSVLWLIPGSMPLARRMRRRRKLLDHRGRHARLGALGLRGGGHFGGGHDERQDLGLVAQLVVAAG